MYLSSLNLKMEGNGFACEAHPPYNLNVMAKRTALPLPIARSQEKSQNRPE